MLMLGGLYQEGKIGEEPDYDKAKEWCEKAMKAVKRLRVQLKHINNEYLYTCLKNVLGLNLINDKRLVSWIFKS